MAEDGALLGEQGSNVWHFREQVDVLVVCENEEDVGSLGNFLGEGLPLCRRYSDEQAQHRRKDMPPRVSCPYYHANVFFEQLKECPHPVGYGAPSIAAEG
jgi:hypothetical protein